MNCRRFLLFLLAAFVAVSAATPVHPGGAGTSGAPFLRIRPMARSTGMGNAYTGVAQGIESLSFNPAGLVTVDRWDLGLSHIVYAMDMKYSYAAVARRVSDRTVGGFQITYMGAEDFIRDANGVQGASFNNYDLALGLSLAYQLAPEVAAGGTIRFIRSELANYDAVSMGADLGVTYRPLRWPGVSIGAAVQNIGPGLTFISTSSPQPLAVRLGVAWEPPTANYTLAGDLYLDREAEPRASIGGEYRIANYLALRGGFDLGYNTTFVRALKLGAGILSQVGSFDYAFESLGQSGVNHRFSFSYLGGRQPAADPSRGIFSTGAVRTRGPLRVHLPSFQNISAGNDDDWLTDGLREIFAARFSKIDHVVLTTPRQAQYVMEGRYSAIGTDELWIGVRIMKAEDRSFVAYKEATIRQEALIEGANILAGTVAGALPAR